MNVTIAQCLERGRELQSVADSWRLDTELLLSSALECGRERILAWPEQILTEAQLATFEKRFRRRRQGEPIAYILGSRGFWSLELVVDARVLVPRPETEMLVEIALNKMPGYRIARSIADLGTGSGAVALSLAKELRKASVWATDISADALDVARLNAGRNGIPNVQFLKASWCEGFTSQRFDMIVSNPPYIAEGDPHLQSGDLRFEPQQALTSGRDGLDDIRQIARQSPAFLNRGGWLLLEHGYQQRASVARILSDAGFREVHCWKDLAGLDRVSGGQLA